MNAKTQELFFSENIKSVSQTRDFTQSRHSKIAETDPESGAY